MQTTNGWIESTDENGNKVEERLLTYDNMDAEMNRINAKQAALPFSVEFIPFDPKLLQAGMSPMAVVLYGWIKFFTANGGDFYVTNKQIGKMFNVNERSVSRWVAELTTAKMVISGAKTFPNGVSMRKLSIGQKCLPTMIESAKQDIYDHEGRQNRPEGWTKMSTYKESIIKYNNIEREVRAPLQPTTKLEEEKHKLGNDGVVLLSTSQERMLNQVWGRRQVRRMVEELNDYICQFGKNKYKSHYHTLKKWLAKRREEGRLKITWGDFDRDDFDTDDAYNRMIEKYSTQE